MNRQVKQWLERYAERVEREITGLCADIDALQNHLDGELSEDDGPQIFARLDRLIRMGIRFDPDWLMEMMSRDLAHEGSQSFVDDGRENEDANDDRCEAHDDGVFADILNADAVGRPYAISGDTDEPDFGVPWDRPVRRSDGAIVPAHTIISPSEFPAPAVPRLSNPREYVPSTCDCTPEMGEGNVFRDGNRVDTPAEPDRSKAIIQRPLGFGRLRIGNDDVSVTYSTETGAPL